MLKTCAVNVLVFIIVLDCLCVFLECNKGTGSKNPHGSANLLSLINVNCVEKMYDISSKIDFYIELDTTILKAKIVPQTKHSDVLPVTLTKRHFIVDKYKIADEIVAKM